MSNGSTKRTRSDRVAALRLPPSGLRRVAGHLRRRDVLMRLALMLLAGLCLWAATEVWRPPLTYRLGDVPSHVIQARVAFEVEVSGRTAGEQAEARNQARYVFEHHPEKIENLEAKLVNKVLEARSATTPNDPSWQEFQPAQTNPDMKLATLQEFQQALDGNERRENFE